MKKVISILLSVILITGMFTSCGQKNNSTGISFTSDNEIFTYERIDKEKTQLIVSRSGNIKLEEFCREFESRNPDIQLIYLDITGGNTDYKPIAEWFKNGLTPDITITAGNFCTDDETIEYFENLSTNPIIENYQAEALKRTSVNSNVYNLPGPSNVNCMLYNKTLFAQYGWEVPATFDEFVDLCVQIRKDTNGEIEPWNPNAKYSDELLIATEAFVYEEVFGGADNRAWYHDFIQDKETLRGHMEPYFDVLQRLIDNDILREEHFSYSATTRGLEFSEGKIAMINSSVTYLDNDLYDFGYMPFPTTKGELGYLSDTFSCLFSIPKKEHSDKEQEAIDRFLEFFSSVEGQQSFIGETMMVSNVKNVPMNNSDDLLSLKSAVDQGHMFEKISFKSDLGAPAFELHRGAFEMTTGKITGDEFIAAADVTHYVPEGDVIKNEPEIIAAVPENMTILETSFYIADTYREKTGADIGLIADNEAFRGNMMRLFTGDITPAIVTVLTPRSFENGSTLVKVSMTGQQLLDALNSPLGYNDDVSDCVYAYSGLICEIAPWNPVGEKYLSVKLADGTDIDKEKLYTVAAWQGTINDEYITEILETYTGTFEEILTEKMKADGTIKAADDGRIKLSWG